MLQIDDLEVVRQGKPVLRGVNLEVGDHEKVAVLGHNGAGKSTMLSAVVGLLPIEAGSVTFEGQAIGGLPPHRIVPLGVAIVLQGNGYFGNLTVDENLDFGMSSRTEIGREEIYELFPVLATRSKQLVGTMSGGERQMVAIATALLSGPRLLLLDEPSIGLAPHVVDQVMAAIDRVHSSLGISVLLVEQNVIHAGDFADRIYVLNQGQISRSGSAAEVLAGDVWELV